MIEVPKKRGRPPKSVKSPKSPAMKTPVKAAKANTPVKPVKTKTPVKTKKLVKVKKTKVVTVTPIKRTVRKIDGLLGKLYVKKKFGGNIYYGIVVSKSEHGYLVSLATIFLQIRV